MRKTTFRRLLALTATTGLAAALAACGPDSGQQGQAVAPLLSQAAAQPGWSMNDLAGVDPAFLQRAAAPLPQAMPMRTSYHGDYGYAPAYDYGPQPYYDDSYYDPNPGSNDYQWLALAAAMTGMLGNAPPDYAFGYQGVQPWAWETGDRYMRYAEPIDGGYRYYYYEPDSYTPFLVSDPYYSYGYRDDRLVAIYDRQGRVIDARRAARERQAAQDYYARGRQMYLAAHNEQRVGVAAPLWDRHRDAIEAQQRQWDQARRQQQAWQKWDAANQPKLHRDWAGEALVRRDAERNFAGWQKADFKTPAPKFYSPQQRQAQLQQVAAIRQQQEQQALVQRARQDERRQQFAAQQQREQQQAAQEQRMAQQRQQQAQNAAREQEVQFERGKAREQAQAQRAEQQRQAEAQRQQQQQQQQQAQAQRAARQRQVQAERANAQRQAQAQRQQVQQQARREAEQRQQAAQHQVQQREQQAQRAAAEHRQQAAREQQQAAQRATQQRQAQQAQQARAAEQQRVQQARAAAQQKAQQAREQQQAQQARAAQQKAQAQARQQAAQLKRSADQAQAAIANRGHGKGHDHG